jgi:hypothetical protein
MEAWLRASGLWRLVSGKVKAPVVSAAVTEAEANALDAWEAKLDKAAGWLFLMVEQEQRVHFQGIQDSPVKITSFLTSNHYLPFWDLVVLAASRIGFLYCNGPQA